MLLVAAIAVLIGFALLVLQYWNQLFVPGSPAGKVSPERWLWVGLIVPSCAWLFLNCGLLSLLPPLLPRLARAQVHGLGLVWMFGQLVAPGLLVVGSYWAAVSFAELAVTIVFYAESRPEFAMIAGVLGALLVPLAGLCAWGGGLLWAGIATLLLLVPIVHCTLSLACKGRPVPIYARAIARMKLGKYKEAEQEVVHELEKKVDDFDGWMMLADLYATQFRDLPEADRTIRAVCDQPNTTTLQISLALHRLADWHLKFGDDPISARRALAEVARRLPDSHFAHMAELRMRQIPESQQEWLEQKQPRKVALPVLGGDLDAPQAKLDANLTRRDALALVNECVDRLKKNPNDVAPRERFAHLLTEQLGKAELGIEQIELLLEMPEQPEKKTAEWLSLLAAWHFRYRHDRAETRRVLERLIREYPQSIHGFAAQRWLKLLEFDEREAHPM